MTSEIHKKTFYSMQHITGPSCVLVTILFGETPNNGPRITYKSAKATTPKLELDVQDYVKEVMKGLEKANEEFSKAIQIEEIQIVPDDYPATGQIEFVTYKIVKKYIEES